MTAAGVHHTTDTNGSAVGFHRIAVIEGSARRRRFSPEEKARIVGESLDRAVSVVGRCPPTSDQSKPAVRVVPAVARCGGAPSGGRQSVARAGPRWLMILRRKMPLVRGSASSIGSSHSPAITDS
jgi:hypothetical protein